MEVTMEAITAIMEKKQTTGLYYHFDSVAGLYIAVDCREDVLHTMEFELKTDCIDWLLDEMRNPIGFNEIYPSCYLENAMTQAFVCMMEKTQVEVVDKHDGKNKQSIITSLYADNTLTLCDCVHSDYHVTEVIFPESLAEFMYELQAINITK